MQALAADGITVLIPPDANKRKGTRPGLERRPLRVHAPRRWRRPPAPRSTANAPAMIEPVFADTKFNRKIDRFQRRGRAACRSEWRLITATHNLLKLHQHHLPPRRLTATARTATGNRRERIPRPRRPRPRTPWLCATATMDRR